MGRAVRKVPANWAHPKDEHGSYIPLFDRFETALADWQEGNRQWEAGYMEDFRFFPEAPERRWKPKPDDPSYDLPYAEWAGPCPLKEDCMPDWPESERTHLQMYETTTEGTPISPVMVSAEQLALWLADNNASVFAGITAAYETWLEAILDQVNAPEE